MKFTHQLKFNSVPEWREHYIQYAHLKKYIYALAKREADLQAGGDEEGLLSPLVPETSRAGQVCRVENLGFTHCQESYPIKKLRSSAAVICSSASAYLP
jgi:hypothetical protein